MSRFLIWAAITKNHRPGSLNHTYFHKLQVLEYSVHVEGPICIFTWRRERMLSSLPVLLKAVIPFWGPHLMTSSKSYCLPKDPSPNNITLGTMASTHDYWGTQT